MTSILSKRPIVWFDIPSLDLDRAVRFYEATLQTTLRREVLGGVPVAVFDYEAPNSGGCIVHNPQHAKPGAHGTLVYLNAGPSVVDALERAARAGGTVDGSVIELPNDIGYIGHVLDTEGNRIGLHAPACR